MGMGQLFHIAGRFWLRRDGLEGRVHDFGRWPPSLSVSEGMTTWEESMDCATART